MACARWDQRFGWSKVGVPLWLWCDLLSHGPMPPEPTSRFGSPAPKLPRQVEVFAACGWALEQSLFVASDLRTAAFPVRPPVFHIRCLVVLWTDAHSIVLLPPRFRRQWHPDDPVECSLFILFNTFIIKDMFFFNVVSKWLLDGSREENWLLGDQGDLVSQPSDVQLVYWMTIDFDRSRDWSVELL